MSTITRSGRGIARSTSRFMVALFVCCAVLWHGYSVEAINIVPTFNSAASDSPSFDPTGSLLTTMMGHVGDYWEDIIEYSGTLNVSFYYDDLSDADGTLADHLNQGTSGGKPTDCRIRVDWTSGGTERAWYFDPTPMNNSEYDMQQTLVRDLTAANEAAYYNGSPHDLLEVNYWGDATASAPSQAQTAHDLFSVLLHEMGHGLGMTANVAAGETGDNDYDFDRDLVWGQICAAVTAAADNPYHLEAANALMVPSIGPGRRRLPSATDILSIEAASNWGDTNIDLQRQDFYDYAENEDWNTAENWAGNQTPAWNDDAWTRCGGYVSLSATGYANNLVVDEDTSILVGSEKLDVTETLTIGLGSESASVSVASGGEVEADRIEVADGAYLTMMSGGLVDTDRLVIENGAIVSGAGTIDVADYLSNEGTIQTGVLFVPGNITITTASTDEMLDLDGAAGNGVVRAVFGDLRVEGKLNDSFSTTLDIGRSSGGSKTGYEVTFTEGWELAYNGHCNMIGSGGNPASIEGGLSLIGGYLDIDGNNCRFGDAVTFSSTARVTMNDSDDVLYLYGATTYEGGTFTGDGRLVQRGNASVIDDTVIDVATFDWDGSGDSTSMITANLTINSDYLNYSSNTYGGTATIWGGSLEANVNSKWTMDGVMNLYGGNVSGQALDLSGDLNCNQFLGYGYTNTIYSDITFESTATVSIATDCTLVLDGETVYEGASITGDGMLRQYGNASVASSTTVSVDVFDMDGTSGDTVFTIEPAAAFTVNATAIDTTSATMDGFDGTFHVESGATLRINTPDAWRLDGELNLSNGGSIPKVAGSQMGVYGDINSSGGVTYLQCPVVFYSTAAVTVGTGAELDLKATTTFQGGSYTGDGTLQQSADATVEAATTIDVGQYDMDGTSGLTELTINDHFTLNVDHVDLGNNAFDGTLTINNPGRLIVNTPDAWQMNGTLNLNQNGHANQFYVLGADIEIGGQVHVDGYSAIGATIDLSGTIDLDDAGDMIQLGSNNHDNRISGGSINGPGAVNGGAGTLTGYGTISAVVKFNNAYLWAQGGTLDITGTLDTVGEIGTADDTGVLNVANAWSTSVATGALRLNGGSVTGGSIDNDGLTTGYGSVQPAVFYNHGTVAASGGTLVLDSAGYCDLDGNTPDGIGVLDATAGSIHVKKTYGGILAYNGDLLIGQTHEFRMDSQGLHNMSGPDRGVIAMSGGTYAAPLLLQAGSLSVDTAVARLESETTFASTGDNTIGSELELAGDTTIEAGSTFSGGGLQLSALPGTTLTVEDGAVLDVDLFNGGRLENGASPGEIAIAGDFGNKGTIEMEIGGTEPPARSTTRLS